nr:MAG TPA: Baseplate component [Caudoviricetes sp.]
MRPWKRVVRMQIIKHVVIDLYREVPSIMVTAKQNDSGSRYIAARITEEGSLFDIPQDAELRVKIRKPDGTSVFSFCELQDEEVLIPLTSQALAIAGIAVVEIELRKDQDILSTISFKMQIQECVVPDSDIESTNEFSILNEFILWAQENIPKIEQTEAGREAAEAIRNTAEEARKVAETARRNAEIARVKAENDRQAAESQRVTAEIQREVDTDTAIREVNQTADDLVLWFESIQEIIDTGGIDGKQLAELNDMIVRLYAVAGIEDIDNIIASAYIDTDDTTAVFNTATNEDIDNMISGDYVDTGDDGGIFDDVSITDQEIEQLINSLF